MRGPLPRLGWGESLEGARSLSGARVGAGCGADAATPGPGGAARPRVHSRRRRLSSRGVDARSGRRGQRLQRRLRPEPVGRMSARTQAAVPGKPGARSAGPSLNREKSTRPRLPPTACADGPSSCHLDFSRARGIPHFIFFDTRSVKCRFAERGANTCSLLTSLQGAEGPPVTRGALSLPPVCGSHRGTRPPSMLLPLLFKFRSRNATGRGCCNLPLTERGLGRGTSFFILFVD